MKTRRRLTLALGIVAILAVGGFIAGGRLPAVGDERKAEEKDQPASGRQAEFIAAYNKGDAKAVAAFWTPDGIYVDENGREYKGRKVIEQLYERVFASGKGAKLAIHVTESKQISPDVILQEGITDVTPAEGGPATEDRYTALLVKKDGVWYLQSVHDSAVQPPSNAEHLEELDWLIGEWTGETEKGESSTASYDWQENQNFIVSEFAITEDGIPVVGGTQWIGWDAVEKNVRSWSFYSGGGFGEASWSKDGNKWSLKTTARTHDGKKVTAINIVTKNDDDHMTWQVTKLTVDGESLPDLKVVKMKRIKAAQP